MTNKSAYAFSVLQGVMWLLVISLVMHECGIKEPVPPFPGIPNNKAFHDKSSEAFMQLDIINLCDLLEGETPGGSWVGYADDEDCPEIDTDTLDFGLHSFTYIICDPNDTLCCADVIAYYYRLDIGDAFMPNIEVCDTFNDPDCITLTDSLVGGFGPDVLCIFTDIDGNGWEDYDDTDITNDVFCTDDGIGVYTGIMTCYPIVPESFTIVPGCDSIVQQFTITIYDCVCDNDDLVLSTDNCDLILSQSTLDTTCVYELFVDYEPQNATFVSLGEITGFPYTTDADGDYYVTWTCKDPACNGTSNTVTIDNDCIPECLDCNVDIQGDTDVCEGDNTTLTAIPATNCADPVGYLWSTTAVTQTINIVHGATAETYCVTITDNDGCTDDHCITITPAVEPVVNISNVGCELTATITGGAGCTIQIVQDNGGGGITIIENNYTGGWPYTLPGNGTYEVWVTCFPCGVTQSSPITVTDCNCPTTVTITGETLICAGDNTELTAVGMSGTEPYSYVWSHGPTTDVVTVTGGTYTVTVTDDNDCTATAEATVTEAVIDPVSYTYDNGTCSLTDVTIDSECSSWELIDPNGTNLGQVSLPFIVTVDGTWTINADCDPCPIASNTFNVTGCECDMDVTIEGITSICEGDCVTLSLNITNAVPPLTYTWSTGETTSAINVCPTSNTAYLVTVTDSSTPTPCVDTDSHVVFVDETPTATASASGCVVSISGTVPSHCSVELHYCDPTVHSNCYTSTVNYTLVSTTLPFNTQSGTCPGDGVYRLYFDCGSCGTTYTAPETVTGCDCCDCVVGAPTGGCPADPPTLTIDVTGCTGYTIQWQFSTTGGAGTWANIPGAFSATYTPQANGFYRYVISHPDCPTDLTSTDVEINCLDVCDCLPNVFCDQLNCLVGYWTTGDCSGWSWSVEGQVDCSGAWIPLASGTGDVSLVTFTPTFDGCYEMTVIPPSGSSCLAEDDDCNTTCACEDCDYTALARDAISGNTTTFNRIVATTVGGEYVYGYEAEFYVEKDCETTGGSTIFLGNEGVVGNSCRLYIDALDYFNNDRDIILVSGTYVDGTHFDYPAVYDKAEILDIIQTLSSDPGAFLNIPGAGDKIAVVADPTNTDGFNENTTNVSVEQNNHVETNPIYTYNTPCGNTVTVQVDGTSSPSNEPNCTLGLPDSGAEIEVWHDALIVNNNTCDSYPITLLQSTTTTCCE